MTNKLPKRVAEIYGRPQTEWTLEHWRSLARYFREQHLSALDGWCRAVEEANHAARLCQDLLDDLRHLACRVDEAQERVPSSMVSELPRTAPQQRSRGRPRKVTDEANRDLLAHFETMKSEFIVAKPQARPTTKAVLTWYFEASFVRHGLAANRARGAGFQRKLKTLTNRISDARHPVRRNP
jgi:hypothetical protein